MQDAGAQRNLDKRNRVANRGIKTHIEQVKSWSRLRSPASPDASFRREGGSRSLDRRGPIEYESCRNADVVSTAGRRV